MLEIIEPIIRGVGEYAQNGWTIGTVLSLFGLIIAVVLLPLGGKEVVLNNSRDATKHADILWIIKYVNYEEVSTIAGLITWVIYIMTNLVLIFFSDTPVGTYVILIFSLCFIHPLFKSITLKHFGKDRSESEQAALLTTWDQLSSDNEKRIFKYSVKLGHRERES